jgi:peptidoglycan hydrolase-like protein with peptidoglycan-binding domain
VGALVGRPSDGEPANRLSAAERRAVERTLARLDFAPGPVDGRIDAATEEAIRRFQKMAGLSVDGRATQALLAELKAVAAPLEDAPERAQGDRP